MKSSFLKTPSLRSITILLVLLLINLGNLTNLAHLAHASDLAEYKKIPGISGKISSVGSDTLANLMTLWAEEFKKIYPSSSVQIQAAGSSTAPPALIAGSSSFGPMSRQMKETEIAAFEKKFGYKPTGFPVAIDALAIFVHKDNPIKGMTMSQVDAIFSSTLKCSDQSISKWGDLGLSGSWENTPLQLFGRNSASGTYGYFKDKALCKGDYKDTVNEQPGSSSVVQSINDSRNAVGYSGIGYLTAGVKVVPLSKSSGSKDSGNFIAPTPANAAAGKYPLARFLYVYINKKPSEEIPPLAREFIKLIYSKIGQEVVVKDGYVPLPRVVADKWLAKLDIE
ncbi:MAG: phosphate ABC transporter substrate-binding protein PstS family protein [Candidatus Portiera sp.]|nr:phosphate ABC transporter substrate-binding protein PstS family protein [Portiera sp.]